MSRPAFAFDISDQNIGVLHLANAKDEVKNWAVIGIIIKIL
jgi:hypothetical protein